jgi:NTP pyrophosphatase (non-canonical NTP hydrolase)
VNINEIAQKAVMYANKRASIEGLESPYDVLGMCRHTSSELFEVIDAFTRWQCVQCSLEDYEDCEEEKTAFTDEIADVIMCALIIAAGQGVDVEKALEKCLEKNRKRAETGVKE